MRIEPAIIAPAVSCPCNTSQAPAPSMADCRNSRNVLVSAPKPPATPAALIPVARALRRAPCQRSNPAPAMPSACSVSASAFSWSATRSDWTDAAPASFCGARERIWFSTVTATRIAPPAMASQPRSGWKMKIATRKTGVQGRSIRASSTGEARKVRTASRSRCAVTAMGSFGTTAERCMAAAKTRRSSRS